MFIHTYDLGGGGFRFSLNKKNNSDCSPELKSAKCKAAWIIM